MKKLVKLLLCLSLVLALTGCGKEQTATYTAVQDVMGIKITDTQTITAKGDKVITMVEITDIKFTDFTEEELKVAAETYDEQYAELAKTFPKSVESTYGLEGDIYKFKLTINFDGADLEELVDAGLVTKPAGQEDKKLAYISFKQTCDGLESMGYTTVE